MMKVPGLQKLLASTARFLLLAGLATARPRVAPLLSDRAPANVWVTVDASGVAQTITPVATTINGAATTLSTAPSSLTATSTYTLSPSGQATTVTGAPPVAAPTGTGQAGAFLFCDVYQAESPFCQPKRGSQLNAGKSYYVTWSSQSFNDTTATVAVQVEYSNGTGFSSPQVPVTDGFWVWKIGANALDGLGTSSLNATIYLAYFEPGEVNKEVRKAGPAVFVSNQSQKESEWSFNVGIIALPIAIGIVGLLTIGICIWRWRRGEANPFGGVSGLRFGRRPTGQGYGVRKSRTERVGRGGIAVAGDTKPVPNTSIQLTDRDSWSPTQPNNAGLGDTEREPGRNVFREELRRQEGQG